MTISSIIEKYFSDEQQAYAYIRNRLLANYELAPPAIPPEGSGRQLEAYRTDALIDIAFKVEDKQIFWSACLRLFKQWRVFDRVEEDIAKAMYYLTSVIAKLSSRDQLPSEYREALQDSLKASELPATLPSTESAQSVYADLVSLVELWDLWSPQRWQELYNVLIQESSPDSEQQCSLMLIVVKRIDWNDSKTKTFFRWATKAQRCPEHLLRQYVYLRLVAMGVNGAEGASAEQIKLRQEFFMRQLPDAVNFATKELKIDRDIWLVTLQDMVNLLKTPSFTFKPINRPNSIDRLCEIVQRHLSKVLPVNLGTLSYSKNSLAAATP